MSGPSHTRGTLLGRLASIADGRARQRDDPAVARELDWGSATGASGAADVLPAGLELTWLGTAGFRLAYEGTAVVIDPFVTRRPLVESLRAKALLPNASLVTRHIGRADAVLVGHTHFDHAVDVPVLAADPTCRVYGSHSMRHLLRLHGLADRAVVVEPHVPVEIGPFTVRFVPSLHSKLVAGLAVNQGGELTCDHLDHLGFGAYQCGQVWGISIEVGGVSLYHQGSANLIDDQVPEADVFLAGIAGRLFTPRYVERVLRRVQPKVVVAHHWDDFFRTLDDPLGFSLNVHLGGFVEEVAAVDQSIAVHTLQPLHPVTGA